MSPLDTQIRKAQHRLWVNRWLRCACVCVAVGAAGYGLVVLTQRLFGLPIPLSAGGIAVGIAAFAASLVWAAGRRESEITAATRLDEAAGLEERLGSAHLCRSSDDPFAQAVRLDAERVGVSVTVKQHIRIAPPSAWPWTLGACLFAGLMFLITPGILRPSEMRASDEREFAVRTVRATVETNLEALRRLAESKRVTEDLKDDLDDLNTRAGGQLQEPAGIRHEAVKKIDCMADKVRARRYEVKYGAVKEMRRMMRRLKPPRSNEALTRTLAKSLAEGDFKSAREEVSTLQEQLATLKSERDQEAVKQLARQLEELAKQIERSSKEHKRALSRKLRQAGMDPKTSERILEELAKKDLDQIQRELEQRGLGLVQAKKLARQWKQSQEAESRADRLARAMARAARVDPGQPAGGMDGMSQAATQLGELEQLQQELAQLESTMSALQDARDEIDGPSGGLGGRAPGRGGSGIAKGRGRGGLAQEQETNIAFTTERGKVHTGRGAIIGQFMIDGEQVPGEVDTAVGDIVAAAERQASDLINRDRIPRQYHSAIKKYFSSLGSIAQPEPPQSRGDDESAADSRDEGN